MFCSSLVKKKLNTNRSRAVSKCMDNSTLVWCYMDFRRYDQQFNTVSINVDSIKAKKTGNLKVLNSIR